LRSECFDSAGMGCFGLNRAGWHTLRSGLIEALIAVTNIADKNNAGCIPCVAILIWLRDFKSRMVQYGYC